MSLLIDMGLWVVASRCSADLYPLNSWLACCIACKDASTGTASLCAPREPFGLGDCEWPWCLAGRTVTALLVCKGWWLTAR